VGCAAFLRAVLRNLHKNSVENFKLRKIFEGLLGRRIILKWISK
jgi:hypothetical protein